MGSEMVPSTWCLQCGARLDRPGPGDSGTCRFHPGALMDYDKVGQRGLGLARDCWDCCGGTIADDGTLPPFCGSGPHIAAEAGDPRKALDLWDEEERLADLRNDGRLPVTTDRLDWIRRRMREYLRGTALSWVSEPDMLRSMTRILERGAPEWLEAQVGDPRFTVERRRTIAAMARLPANVERLLARAV